MYQSRFTLIKTFSEDIVRAGKRERDTLFNTLFNIYINELARALEKSAAPGLTLLESEVKCLLFADDLVLLSPTKEGLLQHLGLLHRFCQTWALTVNLSKTKIRVFQKRSSCQDHKYKFHLDTVALDNTNNYTYLGLKISATGNFHKAVNELRQGKKGLLCHQKEHKIRHTN